MHPTDYASRNARQPPCPHVGWHATVGTWRCPACGAKFEAMTTEFDRLYAQAVAADRWSRAMRTAQSRKRFIRTGEVL